MIGYKNILIVLLGLFVSNHSSAQQFIVESFVEVSDNASAVQEVMKDINDTPCALLRVKTNEANVKIAGNTIGNVMTNGNEYLVNVASGTKKITVVKKGFYPATVICSEYGFNHMQSNALYELTLKKVNVSKEVSGEINGHEYVDLGLSVKWATCNVGANKGADTLVDFIRCVGVEFVYKLELPLGKNHLVERNKLGLEDKNPKPLGDYYVLTKIGNRDKHSLMNEIISRASFDAKVEFV